MQDYKILHAYTMWSIQKQVKKLMADGYKPQGGIFKSWGIYLSSNGKIIGDNRQKKTGNSQGLKFIISMTVLDFGFDILKHQEKKKPFAAG